MKIYKKWINGSNLKFFVYLEKILSVFTVELLKILNLKITIAYFLPRD